MIFLKAKESIPTNSSKLRTSIGLMIIIRIFTLGEIIIIALINKLIIIMRGLKIYSALVLISQVKYVLLVFLIKMFLKKTIRLI